MKSIICVAVLLLPVVCWGSEISVGGTSLTIPAPSGYTEVSPQMAALYELQKQFVAPGNDEFVTFIPTEDAPAALKGEIPAIPRRFAVQTAHSITGATVSNVQFVELKGTVKSQNSDWQKQLQTQLPDLTKEINEGMSKKYDIDLALSISQVVPLPCHVDTERMLAYSAYIKFNLKGAKGNPETHVGAVTTTIVHVKGKVMFLYSYAEESGLEWSREASRQWANAVVSANPSEFNDSLKEVRPSAITGIDRGKVGERTIVGAMIGMVFGLIGWVRNRGKQTPHRVDDLIPRQSGRG